MKKMIRIAQLISFILIFFVVEKVFVQENKIVREDVIEPESIDTIAQDKLDLAQEAKQKAETAARNEEAAEAQVDTYKKQALDTSLAESVRQQAVQMEQQWDAKAKGYAKTKSDAENDEKKLKQDAEALKNTQNQLSTEFVATTDESQKKDPLKQRLKKCIKAAIMDTFKAAKIDLVETAEFTNTLNQLSQKLGELALYERIHFFQSDSITAEQWRTIHTDALANPRKYDPFYIELLETVEQLKKIVAEALKLKNFKEPTTHENNKCLIQVYPTLDQKLKRLEQLASEDSWNN